MLRNFFSIAITSILLFTLAACAPPSESLAPPGSGDQEGISAGPKTGGVLTVALDGEIDTIDPHKSVTIVGAQVWPNIFESLVKQTPNLDSVEPLLAESWEQADDVTYIFKLRQGVKFHNGKNFTAEDVKFSFDRVMDEATGASRRPDFLPVASVEVIDDYTVQFVMSAPYGPFCPNWKTWRSCPPIRLLILRKIRSEPGHLSSRNGSPDRASR